MPQIVIGSIVGVLVVALAVSLNSGLSRNVPAKEASPAPTQLAAISSTEVSPAMTQAVGGVASVLETFDDLPINSTLPSPWRVAGQGSARIVALPTSVDRSVRVKAGEAGEATQLCRPTGLSAPTDLRVAFDFLLGRAPSGAVELLTLVAAAGSIELLIGPTGGPVGASAADGSDNGSSQPPAQPSQSPAPQGSSPGSVPLAWQRLVVTVDPRAAAVSWAAHDTSGAATGSGTSTLATARQTLETLCVHSPAGMAGWIAVDNLTVEG